MSDLFVSDEDLERLTGRKRPHAQRRWLRSNGWPHEVDAMGRPVVAVAEVERRMTGGLARNRTPEPDWSALPDRS